MCRCPCHCPCHCDAILVEEEDFFEFRNIPYNSWIPSSMLALSAITLGAVLIHLTSAQLWFVSLVLWIFAGIMLAKVKYERYTFDKIAGTVSITRRGITGTRVKSYHLSNIKAIIYEKERDMQGGDDVQLFMQLENGKEVKLLAGHFCGIRGKLKKMLKKKLDLFLYTPTSSNLSRLQVHKEKKKEVKIKTDARTSESSVVSSSSDSSDDDSLTTTESSSEYDKSHRIHRRDPNRPKIRKVADGDSSARGSPDGEKKLSRRRSPKGKRSRSHSDAQKGGKGLTPSVKDEGVLPLSEEGDDSVFF